MANSLNTITVDGITYDAEQYAKEHVTTKLNDELGKDAFLQLLVAQMKYQDPLDPQDNSEYIAELANFSALEQMTNVNSNLESLATTINNIDTSVLVGQLSSMIGKGVNWTTTTTTQADDGTISSNTNTYSGVIQGVSLSSGSPTVIANSNGVNYRVAISDIDNVFDIVDATEQNASATTNAANTNAGTNTTATADTTGNVALTDALNDVFGTGGTTSTNAISEIPTAVAANETTNAISTTPTVSTTDAVNTSDTTTAAVTSVAL